MTLDPNQLAEVFANPRMDALLGAIVRRHGISMDALIRELHVLRDEIGSTETNPHHLLALAGAAIYKRHDRRDAYPGLVAVLDGAAHEVQKALEQDRLQTGEQDRRPAYAIWRDPNTGLTEFRPLGGPRSPSEAPRGPGKGDAQVQAAKAQRAREAAMVATANQRQAEHDRRAAEGRRKASQVVPGPSRSMADWLRSKPVR